LEEREAIIRLRRNDINGLEVLVRNYSLQAVRVAYLITGDRSLAEDIMQGAFLRAYAHIHQFDLQRSFGPWFLKMVARDAAKASRRRNRQVRLPYTSEGCAAIGINSLTGSTSDPLSLCEQAETQEDVRDALMKLSPEQRTVIVQRYYLGLSEVEMATQSGRPTGTIKWRLHAARKRLRLLLGQLDT